ncbi:hypothetical protein F4778DRAFT_130274 [Xylariomycetidae sp. FL2044]|nr:hypothetical protein F4778DRAFT_130274 [Xylariomycetidae sp. FL2044]
MSLMMASVSVSSVCLSAYGCNVRMIWLVRDDDVDLPPHALRIFNACSRLEGHMPKGGGAFVEEWLCMHALQRGPIALPRDSKTSEFKGKWKIQSASAAICTLSVGVAGCAHSCFLSNLESIYSLESLLTIPHKLMASKWPQSATATDLF